MPLLENTLHTVVSRFSRGLKLAATTRPGQRFRSLGLRTLPYLSFRSFKPHFRSCNRPGATPAEDWKARAGLSTFAPVLSACHSTKLFVPRAKKGFVGYASSLASGIAIVSLAAALTACGSAPPPATAECGILCEASFWASANEAEVKAQLEKDPDLSAKGGKLGLTPLHMAASHTRNPAVIGLLLDAGADIGSKGDANGATPLHTAVAFNPEPAVAEVLLDRGADVAATNNPGATPLHVATALNPNREVAVLLLDRGADPAALVGGSGSVLHTAAFNPEAGMVALILEYPVDTGLRGQNGRTALHTAALHNPNPEVHKILLEHGSEISAKDDDGMTPLHSAAESNPLPQGVIAVLLEYGADTAAVNSEGLTPCRVAVAREGKPEVRQEVELLLCR